MFSSSARSLCNAVNVYYLTCRDCAENCSAVLFSHKVTFLMDLLLHQLTVRVAAASPRQSGRARCSLWRPREFRPCPQAGALV